MELREFTDNDWHGWAGATEPSENQAPLIGEVEISNVPGTGKEEHTKATIIVDKDKISIYPNLRIEGRYDEFYLLDIPFIIASDWLQNSSMKTATLLDHKWLKEAGFKYHGYCVKRTTLKLEVHLDIKHPEFVDVDDIINELDYYFSSCHENKEVLVVDSHIEDYKKIRVEDDE